MVISIVFLVVLLSIGVIVGAVALRDQIVQEYGDLSVALDRLDQSYSVRIEIDPDGPGGTPRSTILYSYQDPLPTLEDGIDQSPAGITFVAPPGGTLPEAPTGLPAGTLP